MMPYTWNMPHMYTGFPFAPVVFWLIPFIVLEVILKGFALWKAAQRKEMIWFIAILVLNTLGILPAVYLLFVQRKPAEVK